MLKKFKLKKKWRFWRSFKFIYFGLNLKKTLLRFKFNFNNKRILWKQYMILYGKVRKCSLYKKHLKYLFGVRFFKALLYFETRFDVLLVRLNFFKNIKFAGEQIKLGNAFINNRIKSRWYLVKVGELISKNFKLFSTNPPRWFSIYRSRSKRRKIITQKRILTINPFNSRWSSRYINYLEVSFKSKIGLLLRFPFMGEQLFLIAPNKKKERINKKVFSWFFLKKLYFLY